MLDIQAINTFLNDNLLWFLTGMIVLSIVLLILLIVAMVKNRRLQKKYNNFMEGKDGRSLEEVLNGSIDRLQKLESRADAFEKYVKTVVEEKGKKSLYKSHMVRYDALAGAGGQLSFAWALLDDNNDGYIINHIYYRDGSTVYGKTISAGTCAQRLSEEEQQALDGALKVEI